MGTIAFRVDASTAIGAGHAMRCLTLADALRARGQACVFVSRLHPGNLVHLVQERGYRVHTLPAPAKPSTRAMSGYAGWLGVDPLQDARETAECLGAICPDWLVVDHYALDAKWEEPLRDRVSHVMVIDDLADRTHAADLLVDQNVGRNKADYAGQLPATCRVLAGPRFALLRPSFAQLRAPSLERRRQPALRHVVVSMGGVDAADSTSGALRALVHCALPAAAQVTVVIGRHAPHADNVRAQAARMPWSTEVRVGVDDMAVLLAECDVAIGAAGTTALERCCLGLPSLTAVLADNQQGGAAALEARGAIARIDVARLEQDIPAHMQVLADPVAYRRMATAGSGLVDGEGVHRVAEAMCHG